MPRIAPTLLLGLSATLSACAGLDHRDQGVLQPQAVDGPCQVKKFFLLGFTAVHTQMTVDSNGQVCAFKVLDTNLQVFPTASLITTRPAHGEAYAGLTGGGRQAFAAYTPNKGYTGPDTFTLTIQPGDHAVAVAVTVQPPGAPLPPLEGPTP